MNAVYQKTEGNPFFVTEVVRLLTTEGRESALSNPHAAIGLPRRVREAISHRLQKLSPTTSTCGGDCGNDGEVSIEELVVMVNVALGQAQVSECSAGRRQSERRDHHR